MDARAQSAAALQTLASNPRHLGGDGARQRGDGHAWRVARSEAEGEETGCPLGGRVDEQLGMIGVLHTWGRQLQHHPHVHYIVPGGALSPDRKRWRPARAGGTWLLPGAAVAAAFRTGFRDALQAAAPELHAQIGDAVWRDGWWVHTQPAGSGESVVRYLARYVARTAISDERIVAADDRAVTFHYTDTATQQRQECMLSAREFLRRYLQHVLPRGQHRVRYFGWLHPAAKARRMIVDGARKRGDGAAAGGARSEAEGGRARVPASRATAFTNAAGRRDRRARQGRPAAAVAFALPALRRVRAGAHRTAGPRAACLQPMKPSPSIPSFPSPAARPPAGRSLAGVTTKALRMPVSSPPTAAMTARSARMPGNAGVKSGLARDSAVSTDQIQNA